MPFGLKAMSDEALSRHLARTEAALERTPATSPNYKVLENLRCNIEAEQVRRTGRDE